MLTEPYLQNMDGMTEHDLTNHITHLLLLIPDNEEDAATKKLLIKYASLKRDAMESRASCNIEKALELEAHCDIIYNNLPEYARW